MIYDEIIQHLTTINGASVEIQLDIEVRVPKGVPDHVKRIVRENARLLKANLEFYEE